MSKYISADDLKQEFDPKEWVDCEFAPEAVQYMIDTTGADAVEIVRCRDCRFFKMMGGFYDTSGCGACSRVGEGLYLTKTDGYCYLGEER